MTILTPGKAFVMFLTVRSLLSAIQSKSLKLGGKYIVTQNIISTKMGSTTNRSFEIISCKWYLQTFKHFNKFKIQEDIIDGNKRPRN